jgi:hypothetical protein
VVSSQSGGAIGDRGDSTSDTGGSRSTPAPSKGKEKQMQVIADGDEVSSDEDLPL